MSEVRGQSRPPIPMEAYFRTTSYALVVTAFLAIALTGELDWLSIVLYSIAVAVCFYRDKRDVKRLRLREWMWRTLSIAYVPFVFIDGALISNRVLALVHMTLFVSAAKLFQNKRDRDWVFLYLIAFFQMLLAAGLTFDATFVASLAVFLFFFISTLAAFEIRRARLEVSPIDEETITPLKPRRIRYRAPEHWAGARKSGRVRYLLGASFVQIVIVGALTLPFFFLIPRLAGGGVAGGGSEDNTITGFSDRVELGLVASIKKSSRVVMRIRLDRRPPRYLRWRGIALESYDGRAWSLIHIPDRCKSSSQNRNSNEGPEADARFQRDYTIDQDVQNRQRTSIPPSPTIQQMIILEPLSTDTLFATQKAFRLRGPLGNICTDKSTDALSSKGLRGRNTYVVSSDISVPTEQELRQDSPALAPEPIKRVYLKGPPKLDPRIAQLAREISRSAPTPYDKAKAIENYLKTEFVYTLDLKGAGEDPLAEFLFETREGHCEYFATAMAIMLRTLDIPSRIVNGFQMGEYNSINDLFTVRDSDAHSWVEAYFPHSGSWIEFDPTPAAGINDYSRGGLLAQLRRYADAMEVFWLDYIVTLDSEEQASIMVELQHRFLSLKARLMLYYLQAKTWVRQTIGGLIAANEWSALTVLKLIGAVTVLAISLVALYVLAAYRKRRRLPQTGYGPWWHRLFILPMWKRRLGRRDYRQSAVLFYEQMLAIARRAGLVKEPHQTPVEFASASGLASIHEITTLYNRVRFGGAALDRNETQRVSNLLAELKRRIRKR